MQSLADNVAGNTGCQDKEETPQEGRRLRAKEGSQQARHRQERMQGGHSSYDTLLSSLPVYRNPSPLP